MGEHFVTVGGHKARYLEYGKSDQTLVLIHGLGASAERWEFIVPHLEKGVEKIGRDCQQPSSELSSSTDSMPKFRDICFYV